ncbi:MAG: non-ribosomal peptide synthetase [Pseudomonadota bacterium]|nr:non-ribosomal peptide synthetase [Pseudomonadota bacterium]
MNSHPTAGDGLLHGLVEYQAAIAPDRIAVIHGAACITFAELNAKANRIARLFRAAGLGEGKLVATCMPKSIDLVVAVLAVLKSGAAFVPIDHRSSEKRARVIREDCRPDAVIVGGYIFSQEWCADIDSMFTFECLETRSAQWPAQDLRLPLASNNLAWVFYTSGSTGRPKGAMGAHFNSVRRCICMWDMQPTSADEICAQQMPVGSIDWVWETFAPLGAGLRIVLIDALALGTPLRIVESLAEHPVTQICLVPSHLRVLLESCSDIGQRLAHLKTWISTGEPLQGAVAEKFRRAFPHATLLNQYGLTETIATSTCFTHHRYEDTQLNGIVPIGRPILAATAHVLDHRLEEPAPSEMGEIYLGGDCLAIGYLGQAALTAERFVPDPFGSGGRLYRSGDLGAWRLDGTLEYRGRIDRQIKVLGYRVEPLEVEVALLGISGVSEAAAVGIENGDRTDLAAFIVWTGQKTCKDEITTLLFRNLEGLLPDYMVPSRLRMLDALPRLAAGKVDYLVLANSVRAELSADGPGGCVPSVACIRGVLVKAWTQLLGAPVSDGSDFFDSGGDSVIAIRLSKHVGDELKISVPDKLIYRHPRLHELAAAIARLLGNGTIEDVRQPSSIPFGTSGCMLGKREHHG